MALPGEVQSLVDILASVGQDTTGVLGGIGQYVGPLIQGEPISASEALSRGHAMTGEDWYTPGPEGEAVNQELIQAVAGTIGLAGQSVPGAEHLVSAGVDKLQDLDEDTLAGLEMISVVADVTPAAVLAALPLAIIRKAKNLPADEVYELWHGSKTRFNQPDPKKGGAGTGRQFGGHGTYLTDEPDIAEHYADYTSQTLNAYEAKVGTKSIDEFRETLKPEELKLFDAAFSDFAEGIGRGISDYDSGDDMADDLIRYMRNPEWGLDNWEGEVDWSPEIVDSLEKKLEPIIVPDAAEPYIYKIGVTGPNLQKMLDLDDTLANQPFIVEALDSAANADPYRRTHDFEGDIEDWLDPDSGMTGEDLYTVLRESLGNSEKASEYLNNLGIPGQFRRDTRHGYSKNYPEASEYIMYDKDTMVPMERDGESIHNLTEAVSEALPEDQLSEWRYSDGPKVASTPATIVDENAPFPEYANEYPPLAEPVMAYDKTSPPPTSRAQPKPVQATKPVDPETGKRTTEPGRPYSKAWPAKGKSPESEAFMKERKKVMAEVKGGDYEPYFDVEARTDAVGNYNERPQYPMPAKQETIDKHRTRIKTPEGKQRLIEAYNAGVESGGHDAWYKMGQLEAEFIDELGPVEGPREFKRRFADAMAATTGGADPTGNLLMATFGNFMDQKNRKLPLEVRNTPVPVGGRFSKSNLGKYESAMNKGEGMADDPKRSSFTHNFLGDADKATIDEHMTEIITPGEQRPSGDSYFAYEELIQETAAELGITARELQEVAWGGRKANLKGGYDSKPMIEIVNEAIARTAKLTGVSPKEVVRKGLVRADMPIYGGAGATVGLGGLAAALATAQEPDQMY